MKKRLLHFLFKGGKSARSNEDGHCPKKELIEMISLLEKPNQNKNIAFV
jgi:hypothetical protein